MTVSSPHGSFDVAFDDLAAIAYRVAHRILGDRAAAEDVTQEAMARAFARWRRIRGHAEPWVARVAANLALDQVRSHARSRRAPLDAAPELASTSEGARDADRLELVRLLRELPRRQREVVVLRYLADRSEAETAEALGTSIGTVKTHAHRALTSLRTSWAALEADPVPDPGGA